MSILRVSLTRAVNQNFWKIVTGLVFFVFSGLTVDESSNSLYWITKETHFVQFINLQTHQLRSIALRVDTISPIAITVHLDLLFYADSDSNIHIANKETGANDTIFRTNTSKFSGFKCERLFKDLLMHRCDFVFVGGVNSMIVYDPAQQHGTNACVKNRGNCSHLCLPVSSTARVCQCSVGYVNDPNDTTKCIGRCYMYQLPIEFHFFLRRCGV